MASRGTSSLVFIQDTREQAPFTFDSNTVEDIALRVDDNTEYLWDEEDVVDECSLVVIINTVNCVEGKSNLDHGVRVSAQVNADR